MSSVKKYEAYIALDDGKCETPTRRVYLASDYDALAAENAKLREALTEAQAALYGAREVCGSIGNIQHAIDLAATALQPSEQWPVCSVCRRRHGPETQHPCE